jgi:type I restriction-modification system DNA methylase subunit
LYEEKREHENKENRFTPSSFKRYQEYTGNEKNKMAIHVLFDNIKDDPELERCKLFTESDRFAERLNDDFVMDFFIKPFSKYHFYTTKIDGLGAAYEVLGKLSGKDVKVGQFFTPENVVRFMVKLANLEYNDVTLDPACGTGRFLIYAMHDMMEKVDGREQESKKEAIKKSQLFGTDDDPDVSKLAKMNMYIHGDGKTFWIG